MSDAMIAELAPEIGVRGACDAVGVAQASYYRRHRQSPPAQRPRPVPHKDRPQPRALSAAERAAILDELHSERFVDISPTEVWATLLDEGTLPRLDIGLFADEGVEVVGASLPG
ncbi:hypothetical protein B1T48_28105 [Mycobacterium persicum]|nr:hypothetical protein B1T48_28105 [Mycobacterium persicum]